jgi:peptide/nickel transport system substrate-binding protein
VGLGPYRFVHYNPGIELVLEANTHYWRKTPAVNRLVLKSVPDPATRLAMLKNQEADVTYAIYGPLAEEVQRDNTLKLEPTLAGTEWGISVDMYDPKSPWHDKRVRLAANHAVNRQALNEAETLGHSKLMGGSSPRRLTSPCPWSRMDTTRSRRKPCSPRRAMPRGLTPGSTRVMPCMPA